MDVIVFVCLIATLALYVLADGFVLGIGVLLLLAPREQDRDEMLQSVTPIWSDVKIWATVAGLVLAIGFPFICALLADFHLLLAVIVLALIVRGISFRFRLRAERLRLLWDFAFAGASFVAIISQGFVLAGLINGLRPVLGFESLFGLFCGLALLGGYTLLGAGWLVWRARGPAQTFGREVGHSALILMIGTTAIVIAWTVLASPDRFALSLPLPLLLGLALCLLIWRDLWSKREYVVFILGLALFALGFAGLAVDLRPFTALHDAAIQVSTKKYAIEFCIGIILVMTLPAVAGHMFRNATELNDGQPSMIPCAGCRRSRSLPTELHFS